MKKILFLFLLLCAFGIHGQSADSLTYSRFDVGFAFSPDLSYRVLKAGAADSWMKEACDTLEVPKFGFTAGFHVVFHPHQRFFVSAGLLFSDRGERTRNYVVKPANNYINHYYYLHVPLKAHYYFISKESIKVFAAAGLAPDVYLNGETRVETGSNGETKPLRPASGISRINFSFVAGIGLDCPLTRRWYFKLEPGYRRSLIPIADAPVKKYFYSLGLNLGFFCRL